MIKRKKILVMTDSPKLHTGFARVGKEVFTHLNRTGKYEIACIGWFHQETQEDVTYPIWQTAKDPQGRLTQQDKYAHKSFPKYVDKYKPDLVWSLGDMWMVDHIANAPNRDTFKWVAYFPIDGHPSPSKWGKTIENMDYPITYGDYGKRTIQQRAPKAKIQPIFHGVKSKLYRPRSAEERKRDKQALLGVAGDFKIIGTVARNQPRKAFDKLFEAYFYILNGEYVKCKSCGKLSRHKYDLITKEFTITTSCVHCGSSELIKGKPRDDVKLYVHACPVDCGWDLIDLQNDFNLTGKILINPRLKIGVGVSEQTLAAIYACLDIFTLPTRGEGFGLPILEAMSCGVPIVVTDYSAHAEWAGKGGILVPPKTMEAEPLTNIRRAIIDMDLYLTALVEMLDNEDLRKEYGRTGRAQAESMDWSIINKQWENLIDGILYPEGAPEKVELSEIRYTLEEM